MKISNQVLVKFEANNDKMEANIANLNDRLERKLEENKAVIRETNENFQASIE
jgi:hypothetical protein